MTRRTVAGVGAIAGAAGAFAVYASVLRPRLQWLGTTKEERTASYPGDDLLPGARRYGAMATTIAAPSQPLIQTDLGIASPKKADNGFVRC